MSPTERDMRRSAALGRISAVNPNLAAMLFGSLLVGWLVRLTLHLCLGFGIAAQAGFSAWFGLPIAALSGQTLGRLYEWRQRTIRVKTLEVLANRAEQQAKEGK